jgi:acetyl esterase/lipase
MKRWQFAVPLLVSLVVALLAPQLRAQDATATRIHDVIYGYKQGVATTMDVFKPVHPNGIGVLWLVSGGWVSSHDAISPGVAEPFNKKGQTVFEVVHGSRPKFGLPEIMEDLQRAVRFIRTHASEYGVDPNRLGVSGGSSGGHLSLMVGAKGNDGDPNAKDPVDRASSRVQAVACFFPPTDFMNYSKEGERGFALPMLQIFLVGIGVTDNTPEGRDRFAKDYSPITWASEKMPPTLIIHGDADKLVPLYQSQRLMEKLEALKVPHELIVRPGKGHGWEPALMVEDLGRFADWYAKYLGGGKAV